MSSERTREFKKSSPAKPVSGAADFPDDECEQGEAIASDWPADCADHSLAPDAPNTAQHHVSCAAVNPRSQADRPFSTDARNAERTDLCTAKAESCAPPEDEVAAFVDGHDQQESRQDAQRYDQKRIVLGGGDYDDKCKKRKGKFAGDDFIDRLWKRLE